MYRFHVVPITIQVAFFFPQTKLYGASSDPNFQSNLESEQTHEKMLNITPYQRNAYQNHMS